MEPACEFLPRGSPGGGEAGCGEAGCGDPGRGDGREEGCVTRILYLSRRAGFGSEIRQDLVGAGALEGGERFEHYRLTIDPAVGVAGLDHRVLARDLVDRDGHRRSLGDCGQDIQIWQARLHHDEVGTFLDIKLGLQQRLPEVARILLVSAAVTL